MIVGILILIAAILLFGREAVLGLIGGLLALAFYGIVIIIIISIIAAIVN